MNHLLNYSINQIKSLYDFYSSQRVSVEEHVKANINKYKYGFLLHLFFASQSGEDVVLSEKGEQIISEMLDEFEKISCDDGGPARFEYRLKNDFVIEEGDEIDPNKARDGVMRLLQQPDILSESVLMMLIVKYEESISRLYRYLITKYPQAYLSERRISYSELMSFGSSIEEVKELFTSKEVDEFMRRPISDWYSTFSKKQKADFQLMDDLFEQFKEVYYRRNLFVHNQGIVNESYLSGVSQPSAIAGEVLKVDGEYLENAFMLTQLMLIDTFFGLRKVSDSQQEMIEWVTDFGYQCLIEKKWSQAKYVFKVLLASKDLNSFERIIAQVNYWIAIKNEEGIEAIRSDVESLDVSAMQLQFAVAKAALLNKNAKVRQLLDECVESNEIPAYYIQTWPLLNEFRASDEYARFVEDHRDYLEVGEYETPKKIEGELRSKESSDVDELFRESKAERLATTEIAEQESQTD